MDVSRRVWAGVFAALPAVLVSLRFYDVLLHPATGGNREWAENAQVLVKMELLMLFVAALTSSIASQSTVLKRIVAMSVLATIFGGIGYGLWLYTDGAHVILSAGLLISGRFLAAVIVGPEGATEFTERAIVGTIFYLASLFVAFSLPGLLPDQYAFNLVHPAAGFCTFYFMLLALVEVAHIYVRTPEATTRRPTVRLAGSEAGFQSSIVLEFAGDAMEVVSFSRWRAAGQIAAFFVSAVPLILGVLMLLGGPGDLRSTEVNAGAEFFALFLVLVGIFLVVITVRLRASTSIVQVRPGGLVVIGLSKGKLVAAVESTAAETELRVQQSENLLVSLTVTRSADRELLAVIDFGPANEAAAIALQRLMEIYMSGDPSPRGLHKALDANPNVAALLGPAVAKRLCAAPPWQVREGTLSCPGCKNEIAASAPHCGYCGLLYPALEN